MSSKTNEPAGQKSLRLRALSHITGQSDPPDERVNASGALAVLHELASSPLTAASSLKLLHELQVHQVELDMQEEELRRAVADLETALFRQVQLMTSPRPAFFGRSLDGALRTQPHGCADARVRARGADRTHPRQLPRTGFEPCFACCADPRGRRLHGGWVCLAFRRARRRVQDRLCIRRSRSSRARLPDRVRRDRESGRDAPA
jgi:hypothetical protein